MKSKISLLIILAAFCSCSSVAKNHAVAAPRDSIYQKELTRILDKVRQMKEYKELNGNINELKRLGAMYPSEWLADYYSVYLELKLSFISEGDKREALLTDAKQKIDQLLDRPESNKSEVTTLQGYYYYAKIAQNPQENGQLYYKDVIMSYVKAMEMDAGNPRPSFLLVLFQNDMNSFLGEKDETICRKLEANKMLFANFKTKNPNDPNWGEKDLEKSMEKLCAK